MSKIQTVALCESLWSCTCAAVWLMLQFIVLIKCLSIKQQNPVYLIPKRVIQGYLLVFQLYLNGCLLNTTWWTINFFTPEQPPGDSRRKVSDLCRLWCCGSLHGDYSLWKFDFSFILVIYLISVFSSTSVETGFTLEWRFWCVVFKLYVITQKFQLDLLDFYLFVILLPPAPQGSLFEVIQFWRKSLVLWNFSKVFVLQALTAHCLVHNEHLTHKISQITTEYLNLNDAPPPHTTGVQVLL